MTEQDKELEELTKAGLQPPRDISDMSPEEIERLAEAAKSSISEPPITVRSVSNFDPVPVTKDDLLRRIQEEEESIKMAEARREAKRRLDRTVREHRWDERVPSEWKGAQIDMLPTDLREVVVEWLEKQDEDKRVMAITGGVGTGKTTCLYAIARELFIDRYEFVLMNISKMLDSIKPGVDDSNKNFYKYQNCNYLLIDDLGSERRSDWVDERLQIIFDHRWQNKLPTVISTNVAPAGLKDVLGERTFSRVYDGITIFKITGKDRRIHK